ncbi:hypothetical protein RHMOL_Rhmol09G0054100 [Rhododendron molle]|uniref:Uncharacterized protein n=1 Tax=Rhododendron molle TaxID=49168 RepID=A0ACC0M9X8_RHOML|nr:hypothetical protein RHMOL_Rhmol09G0054100 [Rhododendron molle]
MWGLPGFYLTTWWSCGGGRLVGVGLLPCLLLGIYGSRLMAMVSFRSSGWLFVASFFPKGFVSGGVVVLGEGDPLLFAGGAV